MTTTFSSPGDPKTDYRTTNIPASQKFTAADYERFRQSIIEVQNYLSAGILDASITTTVTDIDVVNDTNPAVGPEIDLKGNRGRWFLGIDVANNDTSRDLVLAGQRGTYSFSDGATTSGSPTVTSATHGGFRSDLVGASISGAGIPANTTITAVASTTSITMSANATATASNVTITVTRNTSSDIFYFKHRGGLAPTIGAGVTPPDGRHRFQVSGADAEVTMGGIGIRKGPSQTANLITFYDSNPTDKLWVDNGFFMSGADGVKMKADNTAAGHVLTMADPAGANQFSFDKPTGSGGVLRLRYTTGDITIADFGTDGSLRHISTKLGFYGVAATTRQTIVALTDNTGGTANDTLQAIPDPADTPLTADALRDDIAANILPAIRNDLADLTAKVNEMRSKLATLGLVQ